MMILDKLTLILQENPTVTLKIGSHTDSRGAGKYNMWLSEKRMQRTITYLVEQKGIDRARLEGEAFGETRLVNECKDHIRCSEEKHRQNRRSAFEIKSF